MKKYTIGLMFQDFIVAPNSAFPELQLYEQYQKMTQESDECEIYFLLSDGTVLSKDLTEPIGLYSEFEFNFILYCGHLPTLNAFKVSIDWVSKNFIYGYDAELFALLPYVANATASMAGIDPFKNIHTVEARLENLLRPTLVFHNHGSLRYMEPKDNFSEVNIFYIASSEPLRRHGGLIKKLDETEWVSFYGPPEQWSGIKNYKGSFPFNGGNELIVALNNAGVCLALHSPIHVHAQTYTNRIAEAAAAGALLITDKISVIEDIFADSIFTINTKQSDEMVFNEIRTIVDWINKNPNEARSKVYAFQKIARKVMGEGTWLPDFCKSVDEQKIFYEEQLKSFTDGCLIDVIFIYQGGNSEVIHHIIDQIKNQKHLRINLLISCVNSLAETFSKTLGSAFADVESITYKIFSSEIEDRNLLINNSGKMFLNHECNLIGEFFTFIYENVVWTSDHLQRLIWESRAIDKKYKIIYSHVNYVEDGIHLKHCKHLIKDTEGKIISRKRKLTDDEVLIKQKNNIVFIDSFKPITTQEFLMVSGVENFIDGSIEQELSRFELAVETRLPKGSQIYTKNILENLNIDERKALSRLDGGEHLFLFYMLLCSEEGAIHFSRYPSCSIKRVEFPSVEINNRVRNSLYPHAPLINSNYRRSTGVIAFQLYDVLNGLPKFWSIHSKHATKPTYNIDDKNATIIRYDFYDLIFNMAKKIIPVGVKKFLKKFL